MQYPRIRFLFYRFTALDCMHYIFIAYNFARREIQ